LGITITLALMYLMILTISGSSLGEDTTAVTQEKVLVIKMAFPDRDFVDSGADRSDLEDILSCSRIIQAECTMRSPIFGDYWLAASNGAYAPEAMVFGSVTAMNNLAYYSADIDGVIDGGENGRLPVLVSEAAMWLDSQGISLSDFDGDGDGVIDRLMIIHSGGDQAETGDPGDIWSTYGKMPSSVMLGDKAVNEYVMVSSSSSPGQIFHVYGHLLGLPDLDKGLSTHGIGSYGLMGIGYSLGDTIHNGEFRWGYAPGLPSPWSRQYLGWADVQYPEFHYPNSSNNLTTGPITIEAVDINGTIYRFNVSSDRYYLVEHRRAIQDDTEIPSEGIFIWEIDDSIGNVLDNDVNLAMSDPRVKVLSPHDIGGMRSSDIGVSWDGYAIGPNPDSIQHGTEYYSFTDIGEGNITVSVSVSGAHLVNVRPNATVPDAGVNDTVPDAGVNDTVPDSGVNETVPDAGVNDTVPDAGVNDTVPDAGVNDTVPDAGVNDTVPDDGVNDTTPDTTGDQTSLDGDEAGNATDASSTTGDAIPFLGAMGLMVALSMAMVHKRRP